MRRACLPFCGQSPHAAVALSDRLLPVASWLSCGCTLLLFARHLPMQAFQPLLSFAIMTWVVYSLSFRVRIVGFESNINAYLLSRRNMFYGTFCLDSELDIVAISTMHDTYSFDLLFRKVSILCLGLPTNRKRPSHSSVKVMCFPSGSSFLPFACTLSNGYRVGTWDSLSCLACGSCSCHRSGR